MTVLLQGMFSWVWPDIWCFNAVRGSLFYYKEYSYNNKSPVPTLIHNDGSSVGLHKASDGAQLIQQL